MRAVGVSRLVSGVAACAVCVLSLAILASPGSTAKKPPYKYLTKGKTVGVGKRGGTTTWCRGGRRVTSGGVSHDADQGVTLTTAIPVDRRGRKGDKDKKPDDGFKVAVYNHTPDPLPIKVYAICAGKPAAKALIYKKKSESGGLGVANVLRECPGATRVVGGGGATQGAPGDVDIAGFEAWDDSGMTYSGDDGFRMYAHQGTGKLTAVAVCAKGKFAKALKYAQSSDTNTDDGGFKQANCPDGTLVVGGAAQDIDLAIEGRLLQFAPEDDGDSGFLRDNAWIAYVDFQTVAFDEFQATAICHK